MLVAATAAAPALGDTFDADGRIVRSLHVTRVGPGEEPDYAHLTVYQRGGDDAGWGHWTCFDNPPVPDVGMVV